MSSFVSFGMPYRLVVLLCVLAGLIVPHIHAQSGSNAPSRPTADTTLRDTAAVATGDAPVQQSTAMETSESAGETVVEVVLETLIFGPIILLLAGLLLAFPVSFLAVSLVMDGGCFRFILFGIGWIAAIFCGTLLGLVFGETFFGGELLAETALYLFMWGYPVAAYWGYRKLSAMPDEEYQAWSQTLTGGALLGLGAGSVAGLLRSAGSGFGGFGGGSFGGGGASGSWSGASGAAASSTTAGSASSAGAPAAGTSVKGASAAMAGAAVSESADPAPGAASTSSSSRPPGKSDKQEFPTRVRQWFGKFQWYHGLAFVLVGLVFVPLGLGTVQALQNTKFFVFTVGCLLLYSGYKLFRRYPGAYESVTNAFSSFRGGEASSSWR